MSPSQQALIFSVTARAEHIRSRTGITLLHVQPCHTFEDAADWLAAWWGEHTSPLSMSINSTG